MLLGFLVVAVLINTALANPRLFLSTGVFSRSVPLFSWQTTVALAFDNPACPGIPNVFNPAGNYVISGANFTENLGGRDAGSTWVQFKSFTSSPVFHLFKMSDLSPVLIDEFVCSLDLSHYSIDLLAKAQASLVGATGTWRVPASGSYVLLSPSLPTLFFANETWTVTTVA